MVISCFARAVLVAVVSFSSVLPLALVFVRGRKKRGAKKARGLEKCGGEKSGAEFLYRGGYGPSNGFPKAWWVAFLDVGIRYYSDASVKSDIPREESRSGEVLRGVSYRCILFYRIAFVKLRNSEK